jgi:heptaprenyl diphosphate synthase
MPKGSLNRLLKPIESDIQSVESIFRNIPSHMEEPLNLMLRTSLRGGKRLRSATVILCSRLFKISRKRSHILAAAVEVLHSATLIHDDLVDDAVIRRGKKTIQALWPAGATVLAGDYLLAQAVSLITQLDDPLVLKILAETLHTMSAGEIVYHYAQKERKNREVYFQNINAKTASLFAGATEMVGVLARAGKSAVSRLRDFGYEFGIAYQIVDDILDLIGTKEKLGKPVGSDLAQGVVTVPVILYLEKGGDDKLIGEVVSGKGTAGNIKTAIRLIRKSGAIDSALGEARTHADKSKAALALLPAGRPRQALYDLIDYITERKQ